MGTIELPSKINFNFSKQRAILIESVEILFDYLSSSSMNLRCIY